MSNPESSNQNLLIKDRRFIRRVRRLRDVKDFLLDDMPNIEPAKLETIDLGGLNQLRYGSKGRLPTLEEWNLIDKMALALSLCLDEDRRRIIRIREAGSFFGLAPTVFLLISTVAII